MCLSAHADKKGRSGTGFKCKVNFLQDDGDHNYLLSIQKL